MCCAVALAVVLPLLWTGSPLLPGALVGLRLYLAAVVVLCLGCLGAYLRLRRLEPLYFSLAAVAMALPYVVWLTQVWTPPPHPPHR